MLSAILCAVVGLAFLLLAGLGLRSVAQPPADRIPLIYASFMMGLALLAFGILRVLYRSRRHGQVGALSDSGGYFGPSVDGSGSSHGVDCGDEDGGGGDGGGCGGDGGGGH
jgi:hypothetical protein